MSNAIYPPAMLGILGGGQLGRMFVIAARTMGYHVTVVDPDPNAPAALLADQHICQNYNHPDVWQALSQCAAVTTEFENVDADLMTRLASVTRVSPAGSAVAIAQNRLKEKQTISAAGLTVAPYQPLRCLADIDATTVDLLPGILKTTTLGYDGKGQYSVNSIDDIKTVLNHATNSEFVLEKKIHLKAEISVIVCRLDQQHCTTFPPAQNIHINGILAYSMAPANLAPHLLEHAQNMATSLAHHLDYVGVLAVEFFVDEHNQLLINEMAPRPHNSGHYTLDASASDQFQQQVRLMCGLPPANSQLLTPICMVNLLGDVWPTTGTPTFRAILERNDAHLHLYDKKTARQGRKMGHFTIQAHSVDEAYNRAQQVFAAVKQETKS